LVESDGRLVKRDEEAHERLMMKKMPGYGEGGVSKKDQPAL